MKNWMKVVIVVVILTAITKVYIMGVAGLYSVSIAEWHTGAAHEVVILVDDEGAMHPAFLMLGLYRWGVYVCSPVKIGPIEPMCEYGSYDDCHQLKLGHCYMYHKCNVARYMM